MRKTTMENQTPGSNNGVTSLKDTRGDMHHTIDKMAEKVPAATERLAASAHAGVDKVADGVSNVSASLDRKSEQLGVAYRRMAETGRDYVRKSPAISILVAAAAGYAVSRLFGTRKH
jgi:ElaB/YqjD/DUF883 family membrane-anchored ribosome-binding protein